MPLTISFHRDLCVTIGPNLFMSEPIFNLLLGFKYVLCVKETFAFLFFKLIRPITTHNSL